MPIPNLIIDFDSTFVSVEALDELAKIVLQNHPQAKQLMNRLSDLTMQGMEGKIGFAESLRQRMEMFQPNRNHTEQLIITLKNCVTPSIKRNRTFFETHSNNIYIISGGFTDYILPVVSEFGLQSRHVLANRFTWNNQGNITGYDQTNFLAQDDGKSKQLATMQLNRPIHVIGDGYTDYKIKALGQADSFYAFTENISRPAAVAKADIVLTDFDQLIKLRLFDQS